MCTTLRWRDGNCTKERKATDIAFAGKNATWRVSEYSKRMRFLQGSPECLVLWSLQNLDRLEQAHRPKFSLAKISLLALLMFRSCRSEHGQSAFDCDTLIMICWGHDAKSSPQCIS